MTTFNFNTVEVNEGSTYITPGVYDTTIAEVTQGTLPYGDNIACVSVKFVDTATKATHTEDFSLDPTVREGKQKSMFQWTAERLKHLGTKVMPEEEFNKLSSVEDIAAALIGKQVRIKFGGREYQKQDGSTGVRTTLPFLYFAENMKVNPTRMKYDENNPYDFKRINAPAPAINGSVDTTPKTDDLPF